jgi:signal transduction histidine kinase
VEEGVTNQELLTTINELKVPCTTGVEILNDLLIFEKLDSGLTHMEKYYQDPNSFLEATLAPFRLMARHKQVELIFLNEVPPVTCQINVDEKKVLMTSLLCYSSMKLTS